MRKEVVWLSVSCE